MTSTSTRYSKPMLIFHWATAALVLIALWHYFWLRDGILQRMSPF
jgi:cytochrome b561